MAVGAVAGFAGMWVLDKWGSGSQGVVRLPNPGAPLEPQVIAPGQQGRIPLPVEDYLRGGIRAGLRVWAEELGDGYQYVVEEVTGKKPKRTLQPEV